MYYKLNYKPYVINIYDTTLLQNNIFYNIKINKKYYLTLMSEILKLYYLFFTII